MTKITEFARLKVKRTDNINSKATLAPKSVNNTYDHTLLPAWTPTDIYIGEFFLNEADEKMWIRFNDDTIKEFVFYEDGFSPITGGTAGTGGTSGTSGISGTSGVDGTITGVTYHNDFYYLSGTSTLYVNKIVLNEIEISNPIYKTESVDVERIGGGIRRLNFINGLYTGFIDI